MLYCVVAEEQYNLVYFFVKRIECARANPTANLPYGMFLTRLYRHIINRGKARHSILSLSSHHHGTSSHQHDDDDDDVETSRASTPSPTTYLNSLDLLNYQNYQMPSASEQTDELSLNDKPPCSTKHKKCIKRCAEVSSHLERH
ncbi:hypothetical protein Tco_1102772 [Tanacetum coccineum]